MNEELIRYRRERSRETLEDARILFRAGRLFSAMNRIYYDLFYEVMALLLTKDLSSPRHTGIRALFNEHFVRTGIGLVVDTTKICVLSIDRENDWP